MHSFQAQKVQQLKEYIRKEEIPLNIFGDQMKSINVEIQELYQTNIDLLNANCFNISLDRLRQSFLLSSNVLSIAKFNRSCSGKFKFTTQCNQFTLVTLSKEEFEGIDESLMNKYTNHMSINHKKSFLPRIFGIYQIKLSQSLIFNILITDNLLSLDMKIPLNNFYFPVSANNQLEPNLEDSILRFQQQNGPIQDLENPKPTRFSLDQLKKKKLLIKLQNDLAFLSRDLNLEGYRLQVIELPFEVQHTMPHKIFISHNNFSSNENESESDSYTAIDPTIAREIQIIHQQARNSNLEEYKSAEERKVPLLHEYNLVSPQSNQRMLYYPSEDSFTFEQIVIPYGHFSEGSTAFRIALVDLFQLPQGSRNINTTDTRNTRVHHSRANEEELSSSQVYATNIMKYVKRIIDTPRIILSD
ncbi:hypothetical protein FGO68_gene3961 [Halteria grandinella]|uniref:PIPK domain-containing protein n=1 Tax=Halteria grandinella TaxID=5974 RepID=A0A8J8T6E9_HALGN|nr:hypothetical protein FGO68_gene3961 [Halteria grandinella]